MTDTDGLAERLDREAARIASLDLDPSDAERIIIGVDLAVTGTAVMVYARAEDGTIRLLNVPTADVAFLRASEFAARLAAARECPPPADV